MEHREGGNVQEEDKTVDTMPRPWGGYHIRVYDGAPDADAWDVASDRLELAVGQSDRTPYPRV